MGNHYTDKETVTINERIQIIGLLVLGRRHYKALNEIELALKEITGEKGGPGDGHCGDAIFGDYSAETLLDKLGLKVQD